MISQLVRVWIRGVQTQSSQLQLQPGFVSYQTEQVGHKTRLDCSLADWVQTLQTAVCSPVTLREIEI